MLLTISKLLCLKLLRLALGSLASVCFVVKLYDLLLREAKCLGQQDLLFCYL